MTKLSSRLCKIFLFLVLFSTAGSIQAIIIRHDKADSRYRVLNRNYPQLFFIHTRFENKVCMGTVISAQWALTAGHCTDQTPLQQTLANGDNYRLTINDSSVEISQLVMHPNYQLADQSQAVDLALLKFETEILDIAPIELYRDNKEEGLIAWFFGWGATGQGTVGKRSNDGKLRRAQNQVEKAGQWLQFIFDDPRIVNNEALELEGIPGLGDSGGPAFLETEQGLKLVGVAIGEIENPQYPDVQGKYGSVALYERVSTHQQWIDEVISSVR